MSNTKQLELSQSRVGRIELHCLALIKDHHFSFHLKGIKREINEVRKQIKILTIAQMFVSLLS